MFLRNLQHTLFSECCGYQFTSLYSVPPFVCLCWQWSLLFIHSWFLFVYICVQNITLGQSVDLAYKYRSTKICLSYDFVVVKRYHDQSSLTRPHRIPSLTVSLTGYQSFKYKSLGGPFSFKLPQDITNISSHTVCAVASLCNPIK